MIRHIYDYPYDLSYESGPPLSSITGLVFHINVFAAADKYDVHSLRKLVLDKFAGLMEKKMES